MCIELSLPKLKFPFFSRGEDETEAWQEYVDRIFPKFETMVEAGALIWNFDCQYASWSMKGLQENMQVQWDLWEAMININNHQIMQDLFVQNIDFISHFDFQDCLTLISIFKSF